MGHGIRVTVMALAAVLTACAAERVELTVRESAGVARVAEPVTTGVAFVPGRVEDAAQLVVATGGGKVVPGQFRTLATWPDGSVRWALMDTRVSVDAGGAVTLQVGTGRPPTIPDGITITDGEGAIEVDTGALRFSVSKTKGSLIDSLQVGGAQLISPGSPGATVVSGGQRRGLHVDAVTVEEAGPLRSVVLLRGTYAGLHQDMLRCTARLTAWAGQPRIGIRIFLENEGRFGYVGQPEWFQFDSQDIALDLDLGTLQGLSLDGQAIALGEGEPVPAFRLTQRNDSRQADGFRYRATLGAAEVASGGRSDGVVALRGTSGAVTVAVRHFWQNYDKAIAVEGRRLRIELWPGDGSWPPVTGTWPGNRGGGDFKQYRVGGSYHLQGGVRKGHELVLDFSGADPALARASVASPLMALASPAYYAASGALPGAFAPADAVTESGDYATAVDVWNATARDVVDRGSETSLFAARDGAGHRMGAGSWYGWMDFGDHPWGGGMSSLHYDWTWITLLNYLRLQQADFGEVGVQMARHLIEVDHGWSDREHEMLRHLVRFEFNNPYLHGGLGDGRCKPIPSHMWLQGIVLYHYLTGDPLARECALSAGGGLRTRTIAPLREGGPTKDGPQARESGWGMLVCCSLSDLTGDQAWLDDGLVLFRNHLREKWRQTGTYHDGGLQYYYGVQGLCELHRRTQDPEILAMLEDGARGEFPSKDSAEWKVFLAEACAYVGDVKDDQGLIDKARVLFADYRHFERPVCFNDNQAWDKESGKYLRCGHILQHVLWRRADRP